MYLDSGIVEEEDELFPSWVTPALVFMIAIIGMINFLALLYGNIQKTLRTMIDRKHEKKRVSRNTEITVFVIENTSL